VVEEGGTHLKEDRLDLSVEDVDVVFDERDSGFYVHACLP
jgi:hypothetical protein